MSVPEDERDLIGNGASHLGSREAGLLTSRYGTTLSSHGSEGVPSDGESYYSAADSPGCAPRDYEEESLASRGDSGKPETWGFSCRRQEGNMSILGEWTSSKKNQCRLMVLGPDGCCVVATYALLATPCALLLQWGIRSTDLRILFIVSAGLCGLLLTLQVLSDPGIVRSYSRARTSKWTYCDHCESYRPPDAVHCSSCDVCISGYDHHCPWTGKCVGSSNHTSFKLFTASVSWLLLLMFAVLLLKLSEGADTPRATAGAAQQ